MRFEGVSFRETGSLCESGMSDDCRWFWEQRVDLCRGYTDTSSVESGATAWRSAT